MVPAGKHKPFAQASLARQKDVPWRFKKVPPVTLLASVSMGK
jgi:hypothetical protein